MVSDTDFLPRTGNFRVADDDEVVGDDRPIELPEDDDAWDPEEEEDAPLAPIPGFGEEDE